MQSAIDQKISLSGDAAVKQQFAAVGAAGERAAKQMGEASAVAAGGLGKLSGAINGLGAHFTKAGKEVAPVLHLVGNLGSNFESLTSKVLSFTGVVGPFTAGVALAAVGLHALASSAAESTIHTENMARTLGTSVPKFDALTGAMGQVGIGSERAGVLLERFSAKLGQARDLADQQAAAAAAKIPTLDQAANAQRGLSEAVDGLSLAFDRSKTSIITSGQSLDTTTRHLKLLKEEYRNIHNSQATDARLKQQIKDAEEALTVAQQRHTEAIAASQRAMEKLADAERKRNNEARDALTKQNAPAAAPADPNKAILAGIAGLGAGGDIGTQLGEFADKFKAIGDTTKQNALAMSVFGRAFADVVPLLNLGSEGIRKLTDEQKKLNVVPTPDEAKFASAYYAASQKLTKVLEGLKEAIGNIIGHDFAAAMTSMAEGLSANAGRIREFASAFGAALMPVLSTVGLAFKAFFTGLELGFGIVSGLLYDVFGIKFSADSVAAVASVAAIVLVLGKLIGVFKLASEVLGLLRLAFVSLDVAAGPFLAIGIAIAAVIAALVLVTAGTKAVSDFIRQYIGDDAANVFDHFVALVEEKWAAAVAALEAGIADWAKYFADKIGDALAWLDKLEQKLLYIATLGIAGGSGASAAASDPGSAGAAVVGATGGHVRGPGSGTSDSILARVSNGEFIVNAQAVMRTGLSALHAINSGGYRMGGVIRDALNPALPGYAMGGLSGSIGTHAGAAVATGGSSPVHLHLGGQEFVTHTDRATADAIVRVAQRARVTSAGRAPSWHGAPGS